MLVSDVKAKAGVSRQCFSTSSFSLTLYSQDNSKPPFWLVGIARRRTAQTVYGCKILRKFVELQQGGLQFYKALVVLQQQQGGVKFYKALIVLQQQQGGLQFFKAFNPY